MSFNPHTHEGCDTSSATIITASERFNPHTHEGCDFLRDGAGDDRKQFQSTHPRRV